MILRIRRPLHPLELVRQSKTYLEKIGVKFRA